MINKYINNDLLKQFENYCKLTLTMKSNNRRHKFYISESA